MSTEYKTKNKDQNVLQWYGRIGNKMLFYYFWIFIVVFISYLKFIICGFSVK